MYLAPALMSSTKSNIGCCHRVLTPSTKEFNFAIGQYQCSNNLVFDYFCVNYLATKCSCFHVRTQCQDEFRILSGRTQKLKVAMWCWKQQNEHNLMYIYHEQCENMQKMKVLKRPNSVFLQGDVRSSVPKTQKTRKTRETKT